MLHQFSSFVGEGAVVALAVVVRTVVVLLHGQDVVVPTFVAHLTPAKNCCNAVKNLLKSAHSTFIQIQHIDEDTEKKMTTGTTRTL